MNKLLTSPAVIVDEAFNGENGVYAARPFGRGDRVIKGIVLQVLAANDRHASQVGLDRFVLHADPVRFVNHSCDPNCGIRLNAEGGHDIVAMRAILTGDEITFDYAMRNYVIEHFPPVCRCGAAMCRVRITGWRDLDPARKAA
ncbi:MAG: SET domain-containing protein-lysine N-methyltransferase, partial [Pseudomonadota bacterium]